MISRNEKEDKAPSMFPLKNCQVPKLITDSENSIMKIAAGLFIGTDSNHMNCRCPDI